MVKYQVSPKIICFSNITGDSITRSQAVYSQVPCVPSAFSLTLQSDDETSISYSKRGLEKGFAFCGGANEGMHYGKSAISAISAPRWFFSPSTPFTQKWVRRTAVKILLFLYIRHRIPQILNRKVLNGINLLSVRRLGRYVQKSSGCAVRFSVRSHVMRRYGFRPIFRK